MSSEADQWTALRAKIRRAVGQFSPAALFSEFYADAGLVFVEAVRQEKDPVSRVRHHVWNEMRKWRARRQYERERPPGKPEAVETPFLTRLIEALTPDGELVVRIALAAGDGAQQASEARSRIVSELSKVGWCVRRMAEAFLEIQLTLQEV